MNAITGMKTVDIAALAATQSDFGNSQLKGGTLHELTVPDSLPDTSDMSPGEIFDLFSGLVKEFGSQAAKDELATERLLKLQVHVEGHPEFHLDVLLDAEFGTGMLNFVGNTTSNSGAGSCEPTALMMVSPIGTGWEPGKSEPFADGAPVLTTFLHDLLK